MSRCRASECRILAVKDMAKAGFSGTLCLDGLTFTIQRDGDTVSVTPDGGDAQRIALEWTPCNYGGMRPWMRCPRCGRRASKFYLPRREETFGCRHCHRVGYGDSGEMAEIRKLMRTIQRLDPSYR